MTTEAATFDHEIFGIYPPLWNAPQPAALEESGGSWSIVPGEIFGRPHQIRCPVTDTSNLIPFTSNGHCLEPWVKAGDVKWVCPVTEPQDGDLVIVLLAETEMEGIVERNRDNAEWVATYGLNPCRLVTKLLRRLGAAWLLVTNKGFLQIGDNRICGVVRRIDRPIPLAQISLGAATDSGMATSAGLTTVSLVGPASNKTSQVFWVAAAVTADDMVEVTCSFRIGASGGGGSWHVDLFAMYGDTGGTTAAGIGQKIVKDTHAYEKLTVIGLVNLSAGTYRFGIGVDMYSDGLTNLDALFLDMTVRATVIKR